MNPINRLNVPNNPFKPTQPSFPQETEKFSFTEELTPIQKSQLNVTFLDDNTLRIAFKNHPEISFTIRRQDIFKSGAQVLVNAANTHLGGGGGIDGLIHVKGGAEYVKGHRQLQSDYHARYTEGYAAMIPSGALKTNYEIEHVIVVAGPQGEVTPEKKDQLYSCARNSLELANKEQKVSVAFPAISTGIFGFPKDAAASIMVKAVFDFVEAHPQSSLKTISIHFLPSDPKANLEIYQNVTRDNPINLPQGSVANSS